MLLPPAVRSASRRFCPSGGFTLVELLVVSAIIATLLGIAFGHLRAAKQQAARLQARSELAVLAQALENYRREYGDYPQVADTPEKLYGALLGKIGPAGASISGRNLLGGVQLALRDPLHPGDAANSLVDPWGNAYQYIHFIRQTDAATVVRGHVLYSFGVRDSTEVLPAREDVVPEVTGEQAGLVSQSERNAKNIYAEPGVSLQ
jgi:prepilin-type N-terminal cleavage/methylation domain-containing protein